jgi:acid phosphatase family membrane protein YuiD
MPQQLSALLANAPLWTAVTAMLLAQFFKVLIERWRTGSWKTALFLGTGGMPSSHSALSVSLMLSLGFQEGFGTPVFAICAVLAMIVCYDAAGVRRAAGSHAVAINFLFEKLEDQGIAFDTKLKELLGHKPVEVLGGAILGVLVSLSAEWLL